MTASAYLNYIMYIKAVRDKMSNHLGTYELGALLETTCLSILDR